MYWIQKLNGVKTTQTSTSNIRQIKSHPDWKNSNKESGEKFFNYYWNPKTNCLKNELLKELAFKMNIN